MTDPIQLLDPEGLAGVPGKKVLRQSTLGTADTCHKRLQFDLDPLTPSTTGPYRVFGTAYHAGVEAHYLGAEIVPAVDAVFDGDEAKSIDDWGDDWVDLEYARTHCLELVSASLAHSWLNFDGVEVIGTEVTLFANLPRPDWIVKGTLDLVLAGEYIRNNFDVDHLVVDHKTARRKWPKGKEAARKTNQPAWYTFWWGLLWAKAHGGDMPRVGFVFDVMAHDKTFQHRWPDVTPAQKEAVLAKAALVCDLIDNDGPYLPNTQSFLCSAKWCDHWQQCPFGEALDG